MDSSLNGFKQKILNKEVKIALVGLGYVGLPLAIEFVKSGFYVFGIDVDRDRIDRLKKGSSYITDISHGTLQKISATGRFKAGRDFKVVQKCGCVIICVPTPLKRKYFPDISYIKQAVNSVSRHIKRKSLIVLESTTYPGTTSEVILPLLERRGLKHNRDFYLCFSPERIDPGNKVYPVGRIPKVIGGISKEATSLGVMLYKNIVDKVVPVSSARVAESVKLLENTFRLVNIGLIDELAMMADKMKINIWEVIEAAGTKPFGFMPFYPGPGVGGHCLDKKENLFVKEGGSLKIMQISDVVERLGDSGNAKVEILSFDPVKKRSIFKSVAAASARPYFGRMISILTEDGRSLKVTDLHPMLVYNGKWGLRHAKDLRRGDYLPVCLNLPDFGNKRNFEIKIDLIEEIWQKGRGLAGRVRVRPVDFSWKDYARPLRNILLRCNENKLPDTYWDYLSDNYLPLRYYYPLRAMVKFDHRRLKLITGRGPGYSEFPAVISLNEDFCRLIGYYLSEGCYTKDKSARIRFSFNRSEKEYIQDVRGILHSLGIRTSVYESKAWHTSCIKVSSNLFGFLIYDVLRCGKNCYDMNIPGRFFSLDTEKKMSLLAGIFRGDACVEHFFGKWRYRKNEKEYLHNVNTAHISFFTSSKKLFQQLILLLHDLNIVPAIHKREYSMSVFGYDQLVLLRGLFDGKKREIIERYLKLNKHRPKNKNFKKFDKFAAVKIKSVSQTKGDWVYSVEIEKPHIFVTSFGIAVHNCIPKDPLYLYWKAKKFGFKSRFIKLASDVITAMPGYIVSRLEQALSGRRIKLAGAKILIIGVTYKKDVKDLRKSPALDIIEALRKRRARVSYYDPLIPYLKFNRINLKRSELTGKNIAGFHCAAVITDHSGIDYEFLLRNARLVFDARDVYKGIKDERLIKL